MRRALVLRADDLGRRVINGATFQFLGIMLRTVITIGSTAILARLLTPADFGYIAMATVVTELAALFSNFGFNNLLIQRRVISRLQMDTVFWAGTALGVLLAAAVFVMSFFADWLFDDALVGDLLKVLCLPFLMIGLTIIPGVVLARLMHFRTDFWIQITTIVTRTLVAIGFAWIGFGVWSLVAGALTSTLVQVVLGCAVVPYRPRLRFHLPYIMSTWRTSSSYFGGGLLFYANMNVDLMLIGRQLGAVSLGYYQTARSLTDEIRARIAMPLQHVLFPAFAAVQADPERGREMLMRSGRMLAAIVIPIGFGVSATAPELVPTLYGPQWSAMIPVMSMFGLSAALKASMAIATPLFNAHNRVGLALKYNVVSSLLVVAAIWLTLPYGIEAVAQGLVLVSFYSLIPFRTALGLIGLGFRHIWQILGLPTLAAVVLWASVYLARPFSTEWISMAGGRLALYVVLGGCVYLLTLHLLSRQYLRDFSDLARRFLHRS
ncbi:MAG: lipopolysaccharide biosynthesis protein [Candidatus Accumulibacter necessarius]|uniref:lipopolysaccharide biosynthesis protein n=1 Tax=Candidatus Accumulibacter necessarius TaxID=2954386 RepID=UPI002FC36A35